MRALLDDAAVVHHEDGVGVPDGRQPVGDDEARAARIRRAIARWMRTSVRVSTELVASSRIRIGGSARNARAIVEQLLLARRTRWSRRRR